MTNKKHSSWLALIGISIAGFLGCLDLTIVNTALPSIQSSLNISITSLQWVMTILLLALTTFMVISGTLADLYGRRLCLNIGIGLFALSSLGAAFSFNIHFLIFFRFLQGISIAFLYTAPIAIIPSLFSESDRGKASGFLISTNGLGLAAGPMIGGLIVSSLGWRWIFLMNIPLILISVIFSWNRLVESKNEEASKKIDWWGFIFLTLALPTLILVLVQGQQWGWISLKTIGLLLIAATALITFFYIEKRVDNPIIDFRLFANRIFLIGLCANFSLAMFYAIDFFLIPLYLSFIHGLAGFKIGLSLLPATIMVFLLSPIAGRWVDKNGPKGILMLGLFLLGISGLLQSGFGTLTPLYFILLAYLIFGIGWACILSPSIIAALSSVPKENTGLAMGTIGTLHNLGGAIGLAVGTLIYDIYSRSELISQLQKNKIQDLRWVNQAISHIDHAQSIILQNSHLSSTSTSVIFHDYFLTGYRSAMWLLIAAVVFSFIAVTFGLKSIQGGSSIKNLTH